MERRVRFDLRPRQPWQGASFACTLSHTLIHTHTRARAYTHTHTHAHTHERAALVQRMQMTVPGHPGTGADNSDADVTEFRCTWSHLVPVLLFTPATSVHPSSARRRWNAIESQSDPVKEKKKKTLAAGPIGSIIAPVRAFFIAGGFRFAPRNGEITINKWFNVA